MTNKEIIETKKVLRRFAKEIQGFEKRSKLIKVVYGREIANCYHTQINVAKENKLVKEMINYIKSVCQFEELEENGTMWLHNYDSYVIEETSTFSPKLHVCIHFVNK